MDYTPCEILLTKKIQLQIKIEKREKNENDGERQ